MSIIWDKAVGERLAQLRGKAPSGRVFERSKDGSCVQVLEGGWSPVISALGGHDLDRRHQCVFCGASREQIVDHVVDDRCPRRCRPSADWRMTQHLAAEEAKRPTAPKHHPMITGLTSLGDLLMLLVNRQTEDRFEPEADGHLVVQFGDDEVLPVPASLPPEGVALVENAGTPNTPPQAKPFPGLAALMRQWERDLEARSAASPPRVVLGYQPATAEEREAYERMIRGDITALRRAMLRAWHISDPGEVAG
jgi:hypothetical protein